MFENISHESLLEASLNEVDNDVDKREGAIIFDSLSPHTKQLYEMYFTMDGMIREMFGDTASRVYLIKLCKDRGITPYVATSAIRKGEFNIDVPIGSRYSLDAHNYVVTEKISSGVFKLACETVGIVGNADYGALIPIDYINGLQTASLTDVLIPGEEEEPTEKLRKRYIESFESLAYGGNRKDYKEKVHELQGVGGVKSYRVRDGIYNVRLVVMDAQYNSPSPLLLDALQTAIDPESNQGEGLGLAPIGHVVDVTGVLKTTVSIAFNNISYEDGYDWSSIEIDVNEMVNTYFLELKESWEDTTQIVVRIAHLESRLIGITGVLDVQGTHINGLPENLIIDSDAIPTRGVVSE